MMDSTVPYKNTLGSKEWLSSYLYEMTLETKNYIGNINFRSIGAWRWKGIFDNRKIVMRHIFDPNQIGIDFGGYKGPIGGYTKVIDILSHNSLDDLEDNSLDYIFTSHTLEHVNEIEHVIETMYKKIKDGGKLIILIPSFTKEVWRAYIAEDHIHTMKLADDILNHYKVPENPPYKEHLIEIDTLLEKYGFKIIIAKHTSEHCIFIYGEK